VVIVKSKVAIDLSMAATSDDTRLAKRGKQVQMLITRERGD
jgi:hypothetical protein